jgi:hypothetical protein
MLWYLSMGTILFLPYLLQSFSYIYVYIYLNVILSECCSRTPESYEIKIYSLFHFFYFHLYSMRLMFSEQIINTIKSLETVYRWEVYCV